MPSFRLTCAKFEQATGIPGGSESRKKWERVVPEKTITLQKLYMGDGMVHCMDPETYEMVDLPEHLFDSSLQLLPDGDNISVQYLSAEEPLSVELPQNVVGVVAETSPHIPGARKTSDRKPAYLEHAPEVAVTVPGFVAIGDTISVNIQQDYTSSVCASNNAS